jgi:hypothetical protein
MTWQPLEKSIPHRNGVPIDIGDEEQWANDLYVVHKRVQQNEDPDGPPMVHLSIRNQDRTARHDWRDFQRIKNQLAGPEWEAVEIYPAESRLVDAANQYHLWCFPFTLGIGFDRRLVLRQAQGDIAFPHAKGAVQRDPEAVDLQYGGLTTIKDARGAADMNYGKEL